MAALKRIVQIVQALTVATTVVFVALLFINEPNEGGAVGVGPANPDFGEQIFRARCAGCHGRTGAGVIGPRLKGVVVTLYPDVEDQIEVVRGGREGMPSFDGTHSEAEIAAVVDYTRTRL